MECQTDDGPNFHYVAYSILKDGSEVDLVISAAEGFDQLFYIPSGYKGYSRDELIEISLALLVKLSPDLPESSVLEQTGGARKTRPRVWEPIPSDPTDLVEPKEDIFMATQSEKLQSPYRVSRGVLLGDKPEYLQKCGNVSTLLGHNDLSGADERSSDVVDISLNTARRVFPQLLVQVELANGTAFWSGNEWTPITDRTQEMISEGLVWTTAGVMRGKSPVLRVACDEDGEMQYLDGHKIGRRKPRIVHLQHLIEKDPSLLKIPHLSPGMSCVRDSVSSSWRIVS